MNVNNIINFIISLIINIFRSFSDTIIKLFLEYKQQKESVDAPKQKTPNDVETDKDEESNEVLENNVVDSTSDEDVSIIEVVNIEETTTDEQIEKPKQYKYPISKYEDDLIKCNQFQRELEEVYDRYIEYILECSKTHDLEPELVMAIGSRESGWGYFLNPSRDPTGTGDKHPRKNKTRFRNDSLPPDGGGFGRGLMQIDFDAHEFARSENWKDPKKNICYGCSVLRSFSNYIKRTFPNMSEHDQFRASIASYNCGPGNVAKAINKRLDPDSYTTGKDYSKDVLERMYWFHRRLES